MRVVVEEIEEGVVSLIPDDQGEALYVQRKSLPVKITPGDVLDIDIMEGNIVSAHKEENEKRRRLIENQEKRERLLKRKRKRHK